MARPVWQNATAEFRPGNVVGGLEADEEGGLNRNPPRSGGESFYEHKLAPRRNAG